jgi:16S rRNA (cytosine1402-N4)-methyltransferase
MSLQKRLHIPVLLNDVLENVSSITPRDGVFVDATFGRGGHSREILKANSDLRILGLDCDLEAIQYGEQNFATEIQSGRLQLKHGNFSDFENAVGDQRIIGFLLDLGVSSPQLDEGRRGFSFYHDGPLDMRMNTTQEFTAADIINDWDEDSLNELFQKYGEVGRPYRVTERIVTARKQKPFATTGELSTLIERTEGWRKKGHHPATNYFMALRIEVNQELTRIEKVLPRMVDALVPGGRILVITFHSLEDRIVKVALKDLAAQGEGFLVHKKAIQAEWSEKKENPRARSAKLRVFEKKGAT